MSINKRPARYTKALKSFFPESEKVKTNILSKIDNKSTPDDVVDALIKYMLALAKDLYNYNPRDKKTISINNALTLLIKDEVVKALEKTSTNLVTDLSVITKDDILKLLVLQLKELKVSVEQEDINEILNAVTNSVSTTSSVMRLLLEERSEQLSETIKEDIKNASTDEEKTEIITNSLLKVLKSNITSTGTEQVLDKNKTLKTILNLISKFNNKQLSFLTSFSKSFLRVNNNISNAIDKLRDVNGKIGKIGKAKIIGLMLTGKLKIDPVKRLMKAVPLHYRIGIKLILGLCYVTEKIHKGIKKVLLFPIKAMWNGIKNISIDLAKTAKHIISGLFFNFIKSPVGMYAFGWLIGFILGKIKNMFKSVFDFFSKWGMPIGLTSLASAIALAVAKKIYPKKKFESLKNKKNAAERDLNNKLDEKEAARKTKEEAEKKAKTAEEKLKDADRKAEEAKIRAEEALKRADLDKENKRLQDEANRLADELKRLDEQRKTAIQERDDAVKARNEANSNYDKAIKRAEKAENDFKNATKKFNEYSEKHEKVRLEYEAKLEAEKVKAKNAEEHLKNAIKDALAKVELSKTFSEEVKINADSIVDRLTLKIDGIDKKISLIDKRLKNTKRHRGARYTRARKGLEEEKRKLLEQEKLLKDEKAKAEAEAKAKVELAKAEVELAKAEAKHATEHANGSKLTTAKNIATKVVDKANSTTGALTLIATDIALGEGANYAKEHGYEKTAKALDVASKTTEVAGIGLLGSSVVGETLAAGPGAGFAGVGSVNGFAAGIGGVLGAYLIYNDAFRYNGSKFNDETGKYEITKTTWDAATPYLKYMMLASGSTTFIGSLGGAGTMAIAMPAQKILAELKKLDEIESANEEHTIATNYSNQDARKISVANSSSLSIGSKNITREQNAIHKINEALRRFAKANAIDDIGTIDYTDKIHSISKLEYIAAKLIIASELRKALGRNPTESEILGEMKKRGFSISNTHKALPDGTSIDLTTYFGHEVSINETSYFKKNFSTTTLYDAQKLNLENSLALYGITRDSFEQTVKQLTPDLSEDSNFKKAGYYQKVGMFLSEYLDRISLQEKAMTAEQMKADEQLFNEELFRRKELYKKEHEKQKKEQENKQSELDNKLSSNTLDIINSLYSMINSTLQEIKDYMFNYGAIHEA